MTVTVAFVSPFPNGTWKGSCVPSESPAQRGTPSTAYETYPHMEKFPHPSGAPDIKNNCHGPVLLTVSVLL